MTAGSPASSLIWLQAPLAPVEADVQATAVQLRGLSGGFCRGGRRDTSSGFRGGCRSGACRAPAKGRGQARSHLPALRNIGRRQISNTGC